MVAAVVVKLDLDFVCNRIETPNSRSLEEEKVKAILAYNFTVVLIRYTL